MIYVYNNVDLFFIMMVGLSGSGKTTRAKMLAKEYNAEVFSSDDIREELFKDCKDENIYDHAHHKKVFTELHNRVIHSLRNKKNVIYDATNLSSKQRVEFLLELAKQGISCHKIAFLMDENFLDCQIKNFARKEVVPQNVLDRQYLKFEIPSTFEGFDCVMLNSIYSTFGHVDYDKFIIKFDKSKFKILKKEMKKFNQQSVHHRFSLYKHSKLMAKYCNKKIKYKNIKQIMFLHDIGKLFTKQYDKKNKTTHYYNHENVGAYCLLLNMDLFKNMSVKEIINGIYLINHHMLYFVFQNQNIKKETVKNYKYKWFFGAYNLLKDINECDILASK